MLARTSAALLGMAGTALLFASDGVLPALAPGFPGDSTWLGQLVGAGWLAVAVVNWSTRTMVLGGVYGRPVVLMNFFLYATTCLTLWRAAGAGGGLLAAAGVAGTMAAAYGAVLLRGPFERGPGG